MNGFERFLKSLIQRPDHHARFLNTLSMLEYIGARKIFKSQNAAAITLSLLNHAADEIRHAKLLKKASLEMSDGQLVSYEESHALCGREARKYFQAVDHLSESQNSGLTCVQRYAITTWLVEKRVLTIYPMYESVLAAEEHCVAQKTVIRAILKDEERHMDHVDRFLSQATDLSQAALKQLEQSEEDCFQELVSAWLRYASIGSPPRTPKTLPVLFLKE